MAQALGRDAKPFKEVGLTERDRTVIVTIEPDGRFDWPRTLLGVTEGIHGLRNKGDQCTGRKQEAGRFEVVACEYTPTRSFLDLRESKHRCPGMTRPSHRRDHRVSP